VTTNGTGLVRTIGRWSLAALTVNSIIGSGIFGLPSVLAALLGIYSVGAVLLAGAAMGVVMLCFAEVSSYFTQAGGPYLYARTAFGRWAGIQTGWMLWLVRIAAPAATADLFVTYSAEFWPKATQPLPRFVILTVLFGIIAVANVRGVRTGTTVNNAFTIGKLLPLLFVIVAGGVYLAGHHAGGVVGQPAPGMNAWLKTMLPLVFAYGGFETALTPMGEASNPRRDAAFGLLAALLTCTIIYTLIQWVVVGVLPDPAHTARPVADVARVIFGNTGAALVSLGALVSAFGYLSANMLAVPRITFALAEGGDFPAVFAAIHAKFRTPYFSIVVYALLTWLLAILGNFTWNLTLSAVARLFYYALGCAALPMLRKKRPGEARFRLPAGPLFAGLGVLICLALITRVDLSGSLILGAIVVIAFLNWLWVRGRKTSPVPIA
jgi:APA family basic amino acid/polyamine antiporter